MSTGELRQTCLDGYRLVQRRRQSWGSERAWRARLQGLDPAVGAMEGWGAGVMLAREPSSVLPLWDFSCPHMGHLPTCQPSSDSASSVCAQGGHRTSPSCLTFGVLGARGLPLLGQVLDGTETRLRCRQWPWNPVALQGSQSWLPSCCDEPATLSQSFLRGQPPTAQRGLGGK